ncbi:MAG: ABC transporter permease [Mucilaginibacter sp.]
MFKNNLKIAWRNLIKNGVSSFINIGGLAIGMAVAILIGLWIHDELSFNKYFQHYDRLGQVMIKWKLATGARTSQPMPLGTALQTAYKHDFKSVILSTQTEDHVIAFGDKKFRQQGKFMQPEAPGMFSLKMLKGSRAGLKEPNSIMIGQALARKLFGDADPIDKLLKIDNNLNVKVTGVYKDFPHNTDFANLSFFSTWDLYVSSNSWVAEKRNDWNNVWLNIFVELPPNVDFDKVSARIRDLKTPHVGKEEAAAKPSVFLHPMSKWHLYSNFGDAGRSEESGQLKALWFYGTIGIFVLLLACINFMNLSTARSEKRAKEVGIRKAVGSVRRQLVFQFFSESLVVTGFSFVLAIVLVLLILPWFNSVSDKTLTILWSTPLFWASGILFTFFTGLIAGSYPALYLSSFNPVKVLKGTFKAGRFAAVPRKVLVTIQFTVSIALIIGTIVVYRQIRFAKDRPVGYTREGLLAVPMATPDFQGKYDLLSNELKSTGAVAEVAESASAITGIDSGNGGFTWKGKDPSFQDQFGTLSVTHEYGKTIGWKFTGGRDFSKAFSDDSTGFVINEAAVKYMGLKNPVGQIMQWDRYKTKHFRILGVVKDMVMNSPFEPAYPTIFFLSPDDSKNWIFIKINPHTSTSNAMPKIEAVFKKLIPSAPFEYKFVDDDYAAKFAGEERIGKLSGFFAMLAILISCLGLFGLASFVAEQRTKEIGVRKILGASVINLWSMLSKDFIILVSLSFFIAAPLAFYFMYGWLQKYQYRADLSWWIFAGAGAGAMALTLLTVSFQAVKAAVANPVRSLRSE